MVLFAHERCAKLDRHVEQLRAKLQGIADVTCNRCPFSAHIRKTNPRGGSCTPFAQERRRRVARRGITDGYPALPNGDLDTLPVTGVGLLFHCCQANLKRQFEHSSANGRILGQKQPRPVRISKLRHHERR